MSLALTPLGPALSAEQGLGNEAINIIKDDNLSVCSPEITCETWCCITS